MSYVHRVVRCRSTITVYYLLFDPCTVYFVSIFFRTYIFFSKNQKKQIWNVFIASLLTFRNTHLYPKDIIHVSREYWIGSLTPSLPPPPSFPVNKLNRRHTWRLRKRDNLLSREGGGVGRGAKPYDAEKAWYWYSINHQILSASSQWEGVWRTVTDHLDYCPSLYPAG